MIIDIPTTTASQVAKRLVKVREEGGQVALGRVLTLVILAQEQEIETAIAAANAASSEHPCRIIVVAADDDAPASLLNAQIRVGGDAGASEVIVLKGAANVVAHTDTLITPLLLPDAPIVAWWPSIVPASPATEPIGAMAQIRLTDSVMSDAPEHNLQVLQQNHAPGDVDLAWTRTTIWRGLLASVLDQPPYLPVTAIEVEGEANHPSCLLIQAWLQQALGVPTKLTNVAGSQGLTRVVLERENGAIEYSRPDGRHATLRQPNTPDQHIDLPLRNLEECLAEELRRLYPDEMYSDVLVNGLPMIGK
ncbi:glucose-6-phosphate dehydrogenase assembly protein OpcA [Jonesiaceae bacterium BS-20]|uniref:Glucose-6-phosphate dehydrogenase assembly protein OpcA n=1 Tax=Jonesiaceae bacterium BS-20 TaxID=3120821 RepID=A0AAU7DXL8_9MICO